MHIETTANDKTTVHKITSLEFHVRRGMAYAVIEPFNSLEDAENATAPSPKAPVRNLGTYPSGAGSINVEAWAYDALLPSFDGGRLVA